MYLPVLEDFKKKLEKTLPFFMSMRTSSTHNFMLWQVNHKLLDTTNL